MADKQFSPSEIELQALHAAYHKHDPVAIATVFNNTGTRARIILLCPCLGAWAYSQPFVPGSKVTGAIQQSSCNFFALGWSAGMSKLIEHNKDMGRMWRL
jgi:hypothetical protein